MSLAQDISPQLNVKWYRAMHCDPLFPQPVKLRARCIGFREADIDALIERLSTPSAEGVRDA
jgi:predicted DNA-binding transcriptional regulator AlpA